MQTETNRVYSSYLELDLCKVEPCVAGPKRYIYGPSCILIINYLTGQIFFANANGE
jgi:hypothetical protein